MEEAIYIGEKTGSNHMVVMLFVGMTVGFFANSVLAQSKIDIFTNQIDALQAQLEIEILGVYFSPNGECESKVI